MLFLIYIIILLLMAVAGYVSGDHMYKIGYDDGNFDGRKCYYNMQVKKYQKKERKGKNE